MILCLFLPPPPFPPSFPPDVDHLEERCLVPQGYYHRSGNGQEKKSWRSKKSQFNFEPGKIDILKESDSYHQGQKKHLGSLRFQWRKICWKLVQRTSRKKKSLLDPTFSIHLVGKILFLSRKFDKWCLWQPRFHAHCWRVVNIKHIEMNYIFCL